MVEVFEPSYQLLIALLEKMDEIPLSDGSVIIEYPNDMKTKRIYRKANNKITNRPTYMYEKEDSIYYRCYWMCW